jgi:hypothetical protein
MKIQGKQLYVFMQCTLTWIKAAFNNNETALWRPSWWESATAGHNFGKGPSNVADLTFILIKNITFELILLSLYLYAVMIILREVIKLNPWT